MEECGTDGQGTDYNIIWRMRTAFCIPKATNEHSEYVIFTDLPQKQWFKYYVICTLSCLVSSNGGILNDHSSKPFVTEDAPCV